MLNGASVHLEVSLVMSCDLRLDINDGPRGVALLDDGGHDATDSIGRKIVVVIAHFAAHMPADVQTMRTRFRSWIRARSAAPLAIEVRVVVT